MCESQRKQTPHYLYGVSPTPQSPSHIPLLKPHPISPTPQSLSHIPLLKPPSHISYSSIPIPIPLLKPHLISPTPQSLSHIPLLKLHIRYVYNIPLESHPTHPSTPIIIPHTVQMCIGPPNTPTTRICTNTPRTCMNPLVLLNTHPHPHMPAPAASRQRRAQRDRAALTALAVWRSLQPARPRRRRRRHRAPEAAPPFCPRPIWGACRAVGQPPSTPEVQGDSGEGEEENLSVVQRLQSHSAAGPGGETLVEWCSFEIIGMQLPLSRRNASVTVSSIS